MILQSHILGLQMAEINTTLKGEIGQTGRSSVRHERQLISHLINRAQFRHPLRSMGFSFINSSERVLFSRWDPPSETPFWTLMSMRDKRLV